jgi:hypothetical protein
MKVKDFIEEVLSQIHHGCASVNAQSPSKVEFTIQLNEDGNVCSTCDLSIANVKVEI